ncbi:MAG: serine/threonine-protein kinase [Roseobacter sp.]
MSDFEETEAHELGDDALAPGSKLLSGQYEIQRYLSSGGFGITYLASDSLNRTVVIKECFPEAFCSRVNRTVRARTKNYLDDFRSIVKLFVREAHALSRLDHPSVVGVHQVFEDNETAYMALDLIDGKDLLDIIESGSPKMSPDEVRALTLQLLDAVGHVHAQDLLHRDISPDNILIDKKGHPVLIDFGAAREEASRKSRVLSSVLVVKDGYSPQEFYVTGSQQAPCSDLYALAATLAHLISGDAPPNSQARLAALASSQPDLYVPLAGRFPGYDAVFLEAIDKAMSIVPAERLQSAEDWALMIDRSKQLELARARAQEDQSIDQTIMQLVKSEGAAPDPQEIEPSSNIRAIEDAPVDQVAEKAEAAIKAVLDLIEPPEDDTYLDVPIGDQMRVSAAPVLPKKEAKPTPYMRVASRAVKPERVEPVPTPKRWVPQDLRRVATVPVVFCAYFFYAHTMLQFDVVRAATVEPIVSFGEEIGSWNEPSAPTVSVRRGIGG